MRVLVTRAEEAGRKTAKRLADLGHSAVLLPLASPVHQPDQALAALAKGHSALAFTSAEACRALLPLRETLVAHQATPVFCVGKKTADAAEKLGFKHIITAEGDGAVLAARVSDEPIDWRSPLLYLAGQPRARGFEKGLDAHAIPFCVADAYRMETVCYDQQGLRERLQDIPVDAVLIYSAETARRFMALPLDVLDGAVFGRSRFLCLSAKVAEALAPGWRERAEIASAPDEASLFTLL
ncbi:uroporphyrinogen-III synthase [Allorhizobium sp. BGMRC 0089]|uniref:uroporphyrinogen-III synthase n=1 Tax=Allorhizobium sonneratiae TaxID=2934936 RepID=UPI0020334C3E|nr:uroporphyrinogen-III synthase [Allorhizobium sonneratiae]MCM2293427.1 uroporphyrinogen-III synthase [Allorhizobium sonneratiae]